MLVGVAFEPVTSTVATAWTVLTSCGSLSVQTRLVQGQVLSHPQKMPVGSVSSSLTMTSIGWRGSRSKYWIHLPWRSPK